MPLYVTGSSVINGGASASGDITPSADATYNLGSDTLRWSTIRGVTVTSGDLHLHDEERGAHWVLREEPDSIVAINMMTGKRYQVALNEEGGP